MTLLISLFTAGNGIAEDFYQKGKEAYKQKDYGNAAEYFQKAYDKARAKGKKDKESKVLYWLARSSYKNKDYDSALKSFQTLQKLDSTYKTDKVTQYIAKIQGKIGSLDLEKSGNNKVAIAKSLISAMIQKSVSNKSYYADYSGVLTSEDNKKLQQITKDARDKGFTLYMYAIKIGNYQRTLRIASLVPKKFGFETLELLILLDAHPKGGFAVGSDYISKEKQQHLSQLALREYFKEPPAGRTKYGYALEKFATTIIDKSNFKQSAMQFSLTLVILIILGIGALVAITIIAARKLKQKSLRDKLDQARDLLFEINTRHSDLKDTNEHFINWSTQIDSLEKENNWKNPAAMDTLLSVLKSYLDNPKQPKAEIEKPLRAQVSGNIRIEKVRRDDNKEYFCYSTGEPITTPEIYLATIKQDDGSELRVALSEKVAQQALQDPTRLQVRTYMHEGKPTPWYNVPDYRYDPYDRSYSPIFWYSLGSMMSHGHYGYGSHYNSGYYINDNDYNRYEHIGGSSVSDSAGSDYADGAVGSGFGDSQGKDDSVGSSFSDNS